MMNRFDPAKHQRRRKAAARWLAAAGAGLAGVLASVAPAQTNPAAVPAPLPVAAPLAPVQTSVSTAALSPTNAINQTAPPPATNTVSFVESLRTDPAFQPYTNLVDHSLFVPSSEIGGGGGASEVGPTFAGSLRVTGFYKRGDDIQASIEDRSDPDKKLFVRVGDSIADTDIKVVGFDLQGRAGLLKKGYEEGRLEYESEAMPPPATGKPGVPGMPGVPAPPGMQAAPRPGVAPLPPPPGAAPNMRPGTAPSAAPSAATDAASRLSARKQQRQQTITRLQQTLQTTTDPAARQRLQNYIQMLEKANAQE